MRYALGFMVCVIAAAALSACKHPDATVAPGPQPPPNEVWLDPKQVEEAKITVEEVALQNVDDTILTSGRVAFADIKVGHVFSPVTGRVIAIKALLGARVKKGDPLAVIQSPDVGQFSSDVGKANADLAAAERDYRREKELWEKHATSQKDFETAEDTYRKAKAEKDRAVQKAYMLQSGNVDAVSQSYTLPSPLDGEVLTRNLSMGTEVQGQYNGTGSPQELYTIGEVDEVWVLADVYELDMARVTVGSKATVRVVAYPDKTFEGRVDWVSGMLDPVARTARVRCTFANPDRLLKPEMYATIAISVEERRELAIPKGSALRLGDQNLVFVQRENTPAGKLRFQALPVKIDEGETSHWLPVAEGLQPGMKIVTGGAVLLSAML